MNLQLWWSLNNQGFFGSRVPPPDAGRENHLLQLDVTGLNAKVLTGMILPRRATDEPKLRLREFKALTWAISPGAGPYRTGYYFILLNFTGCLMGGYLTATR